MSKVCDTAFRKHVNKVELVTVLHKPGLVVESEENMSANTMTRLFSIITCVNYLERSK